MAFTKTDSQHRRKRMVDYSVIVADATDAALIEAIKRLEKHHVETQNS